MGRGTLGPAISPFNEFILTGASRRCAVAHGKALRECAHRRQTLRKHTQGDWVNYAGAKKQVSPAVAKICPCKGAGSVFNSV